MIDIIAQHQQEIADICRQLKVRRLEIFGSAARGDFDPDQSDIDFLVEFDETDASSGLLGRYLSLAERLEKILGRQVDLITPRSIRNFYFKKAVEASREPVYAG
ncbi:MAG: nucleotidyltransferase family protein [Desulfosudaceae bacterium]